VSARRTAAPGRALVLLGALVLGVVGAAGCSNPEPKASSAVPPPAEVDTDPTVWAALGGSETVVFDPADAPHAWLQVALSQLPVSAQLVDLATPDATVSAALESQLAALQASPVVPTVATLWFGAADRSSSSGQYQSGLVALIDALRQRGVARVVVVTRTDTGVGDRAADNEAVAAEQGVELVTIERPDGDPSSPEFQAAIAARIVPALG
jgi:hypothetical protein